MTAKQRLRFLAVIVLAVLCAGLVGWLWLVVWPGRSIGETEAGWMAAAFLAIREFISKIENIVNGPAAALPEDRHA